MFSNKHADIKIVLLGDCGVGKTNIFTRIFQNSFSLESKPSKDIQIVTNNIMIEDRVLKAQVWDTTGDRRFASIKKSYMQNAKIVIIICDVTRKSTFNNIEKWATYVKNYADPHAKIIVVGNKSDLHNLREIQSQEAATLTESKGLPYLEVSALNSMNIELLYHSALAEGYLKLLA